MRKFLLYFSALLLISLISFILFFRPEPVKFNTVTVAGQFSIAVPAYLSQTDSIDPHALLQFKNEKEQMFLLVYKSADTGKLPLQTSFENFSNDFIARIGDAALLKYYPKKINSCQAIVGNIRGTVNETGVYYRIAAIGSDHSAYNVIIGIRSNNLVGFDEDIDQVINSFAALK